MRLLILIMSFCLVCAAIPARAEPYKLQPGDEVEIWVAQDNRMNREAVITPDGTISVPLAGQVMAQNLTLDQLEATLKEKLASFFKNDLDLTVMLQPGAQHLPMIYVVGDVDEPGSFAFRPTMTVLHAVTVAGGLYRTPMEARDQDRAVVVEGQIEQSKRQMADLTVRIARINAELAGHDTIELRPGTLPDLTDAERNLLIERERQVLAAHLKDFTTQQETQNKLNTLGDSGMEAIRRQIDSVKNRVDLARQRLAATTQLVSKGLAHNSARLELEAEVAELTEEGDQLESDLSALESTTVNERSRLDTYFAQRQSNLLNELHDAERQLDAARSALAESERVMSIYTNSEIAERRGIEASYSIIRSENGVATETAADETTLLQPGDLVRVTFVRNTQRSAALGSEPSAAGN